MHPTAMYRHFRDKDDLMLALVDALQAQALEGLSPPSRDWFVLAYSAHDAALKALEPQIRWDDLRAWDIDYRRLDADAYPNIHAVAGSLPSLEDPDNFEVGPELMIESIRVRAKRARAAARVGRPGGTMSGAKKGSAT